MEKRLTITHKNKIKLVPTHKYKTRVVFFDDDIQFLEELQDTVVSSKYELIFVNNLNDFTRLITESYHMKEDLPSILEPIDNELSDLSDSEVLRFDLSRFREIKRIANKEKEVAAVIVDHNLERLNGIDVCAELKDNAVERILLTGDCDYSVALNAMNDKKIQVFIDKLAFSNRFTDLLDDDLDRILLRNIDIAVDRYFIGKDSYNNNLLSNPQFKKLYKSIVKSHNIIEHYLVEKDTLLLINQTGEEFILKCWMLDDFDYYYQGHYDESNILAIERLDTIKNAKKLPIGDNLVNTIQFEDLYYCLFEGAV